MKKSALIVLVVSVGVALAGCSNSNNSATTSSPTAAQGALSDADPWLQSKKFVREQITDPALYSYLSASGIGNVSSQTRSDLTAIEQAKIGKIATFNRSSKYGIAGTAEITAVDTINIKNFTYNGACGTISLTLAANNSPEKSIATLKSIPTALSSENGNFALLIPTNVSLIQFNMVNVLCQNVEAPVAQAMFD